MSSDKPFPRMIILKRHNTHGKYMAYERWWGGGGDAKRAEYRDLCGAVGYDYNVYV